ncbi:hypothetical protein BT69DRAFT_1304804 [Atractiella rhizophila]|nr:hypothetical protein BT69DRAFT_1304804 [Atractiella rhizophila]
MPVLLLLNDVEERLDYALGGERSWQFRRLMYLLHAQKYVRKYDSCPSAFKRCKETGEGRSCNQCRSLPSGHLTIGQIAAIRSPDGISAGSMLVTGRSPADFSGRPPSEKLSSWHPACDGADAVGLTFGEILALSTSTLVKFGLEFGTFWDDSGRIRGKWEAARSQDLEQNGTFGTVSFSFARRAEIDPTCSPVWARLSSGIGGMEVLDKSVCLGSFLPLRCVCSGGKPKRMIWREKTNL